MRKLAIALCATLAASAAKLPPKELHSLAQKGASPELAQALTDTLGADNLKAGKAVSTDGGDFLWAVQSDTAPELYVDDQRAQAMRPIAGTNLYFATGHVRPGTSHSFYYLVRGARFGGQTDVAAFLPDSYEKPGVPQGKLTEKRVHTSKLYEGMQSNYWVYVPAAYNPNTPAPVMVWQDGEGHVNRDRGPRTLIAIDNLT